MFEPLISIVIPCYNDAQFIEQSVDSALAQTYQNKEVIVVDDGSNDETKLVLNRLEPKITRLISQQNKGQSTARNVGIEASKGTYVLVLDSDDYFAPTFSEKAVALFLKDRGAKIVSCYANLLFEDGSSRLYKSKGGRINDFLFSNNSLGTAMFKREDWSISGGYDEEMRFGFEDWEFFIRLLKNGGSSIVIEEALYNYRKREDSTTARANKKEFELLNYIFLKHKALYSAHYESLVSHLLKRLEKSEGDKVKYLKTIDFRVGNNLLKPFRKIKKFLGGGND